MKDFYQKGKLQTQDCFKNETLRQVLDPYINCNWLS